MAVAIQEVCTHKLLFHNLRKNPEMPECHESFTGGSMEEQLLNPNQEARPAKRIGSSTKPTRRPSRATRPTVQDDHSCEAREALRRRMASNRLNAQTIQAGKALHPVVCQMNHEHASSQTHHHCCATRQIHRQPTCNGSRRSDQCCVTNVAAPG